MREPRSRVGVNVENWEKDVERGHCVGVCESEEHTLLRGGGAVRRRCVSWTSGSCVRAGPARLERVCCPDRFAEGESIGRR